VCVCVYICIYIYIYYIYDIGLGVSTVVVRMPDGSRLPSRRFKESDTVAHVYAYVRISMRERGNTEAFELISNMPALTLKEDDTSLADAQVQGQVLLICQPTA